jgi:hypothetical protein
MVLDVDSVDLDGVEWTSDINNVASVMKLWLRELPEPLLTHSLHQGFIEAASGCRSSSASSSSLTLTR